MRVVAGELIISGAAFEDSGVYKCLVSNGRATATALTSVKINTGRQGANIFTMCSVGYVDVLFIILIFFICDNS